MQAINTQENHDQQTNNASIAKVNANGGLPGYESMSAEELADEIEGLSGIITKTIVDELKTSDERGKLTQRGLREYWEEVRNNYKNILASREG